MVLLRPGPDSLSPVCGSLLIQLISFQLNKKGISERLMWSQAAWFSGILSHHCTVSCGSRALLAAQSQGAGLPQTKQGQTQRVLSKTSWETTENAQTYLQQITALLNFEWKEPVSPTGMFISGTMLVRSGRQKGQRGPYLGVLRGRG